MTHQFARRGRMAVLLAGVASAVFVAGAAAQGSTYNFNIPAQDAARSLQEFGRQSGKQILFPYEAVAGKRTPAVTGVFSDTEVIGRLAAASGLAVASDNGRTVTLQPAASAAAFEPSSVADVGEVVVTASRADTTGFSAPTPTTVFSADTLASQGVTNVAQVINNNPAFKSSNSPAGNGAKVAAPGQNSPDLRGLGTARTLVLVNGLRVPPLAPTTNNGVGVTTDLNIIPSIMIQRMEVVTGGASAQWGSDAVSGVLNIILDNSFDGLRLRAQAGQSERGDAENGSLALMAGTDFAGGRGHVVVAGEYERSAGLGDYQTRSYMDANWAAVSNSARATNGGPAWLVVPHTASSTASGGKIIGPTNFSLLNYTFNPDGTIRPFNNGSLVSGLFTVGGEGPPPYAGLALIPRFNRYTFYARGQYELTDSLTAAVELSWARTKGGAPGSVPRLASVTIRNDNPFLPTAVRTAMTAQNLTSFTMNRLMADVGNSNNEVTSETPHVAFSLKGELPGDWSWDANFGYGENKYERINYNTLINGTKRDATGAIVNDNRRVNWAADAVVNPATGQIVCRATLPGAGFIAAAAGCVPISLFGEGRINPAALGWLIGDPKTSSKYTQQHATFNIRGRPFSTSAGPVAIGAGVEYRHEEQSATATELSQQAAFITANVSPFSGKFSVKEAYIDTITPLARDLAFAKAVDVTASARVSDYSTAGTLWAWKLGMNWEPVDGLRFRVTKSRDVRAPSIYQLQSEGSWVTNAVTVGGVTYPAFPQNFSAGNPNLEAEIGKTLTIGGVIEPKFLPGFRASVDYFDIKVSNAIGALNSVTVAGLCDSGNAFFCGLFLRDASGQPVALLTGPANLGAQQVEGVEFAVNYSRDLSQLFGGGPNARLSLSASGSYIMHSWVDTGALGSSRIDRANENSQQSEGALPRLRVDFTQSLAFEKLTVTARQRFVSRGHIDNTFNTLPSNTINTNAIPAVVYMDLFGTYKVNDKLTLFAAVDNLFDKKPPVAPYPDFIVPAVAGTYYDKVLRAYRVGITYDF